MDFLDFNISSSFKDQILSAATAKPSDNTNTNPIPLWGSVLIAIAGGIFLICCVVFACKLCRRNKNKFKSGQHLNFKDIQSENMFESDKVQPDLEDLHIKQEHYGKLHFMLEYDKSAEELEVTVAEASKLHVTHLLTLSNPLIRVHISPDLKTTFETNVHRMTVNPVFHEKFCFKLPYTTRNTKTLIFCVYHDHLLVKPEKIGELRVPLGAYDFLKSVDEWYDLEKPGPDEKVF